jgi:hypothetical protein
MAEIDPQDPLPDASWVFRRIMAFGLVAATVLGQLYVAWRLASLGSELKSADALAHMLEISKIFAVELLVVVTYYMVAPSAEQIVKIIQVASMLKRGVPLPHVTGTTATKDNPATPALVSTPPQQPPTAVEVAPDPIPMQSDPAAAPPEGAVQDSPPWERPK